jgi:hypothetical protein
VVGIHHPGRFPPPPPVPQKVESKEEYRRYNLGVGPTFFAGRSGVRVFPLWLDPVKEHENMMLIDRVEECRTRLDK